jgi:ubiquitin conjugation factor E4 B
MEQEERQRLLSSQAVTQNNGASISAPSTSTPPQKYSFICECFFLTARVLNLGLLKALSDFKLVMQVCALAKFKLG